MLGKLFLGSGTVYVVCARKATPSRLKMSKGGLGMRQRGAVLGKKGDGLEGDEGVDQRVGEGGRTTDGYRRRDACDFWGKRGYQRSRKQGRHSVNQGRVRM